MKKHVRMTAVTAAACLALVGCSSDDGGGSDDGASVSFSSPADGATVTSPVSLSFSADGVDVGPAGEVVDGEGHFHVMIDTDCIAEGEVIPNDDTHRHFGDGSTSTDLELEPGEHTLCLQLADGAHTAFDLTDTITITVE